MCDHSSACHLFFFLTWLASDSFNSLLFAELVQNNSYLLEEKHELEYKLNRTAETSTQQIRDLEETIEKLNEEIKAIKGE